MAKEMKRVLRENTTVDTQTGEVLKRETTVQFSKEPGFVKLYFDCLGVYIKNDGLSASLNDMLLEVLHRASLCTRRANRTPWRIRQGANLQSDSQEHAPLRTGHYDMG